MRLIMLHKDQNGFNPVGLLLVLALAGIVGFAAYRVYDQRPASDVTQEVTTKANEIKNKDDLKKVEQELKNINLDELDTSGLEQAEKDLL